MFCELHILIHVSICLLAFFSLSLFLSHFHFCVHNFMFSMCVNGLLFMFAYEKEKINLKLICSFVAWCSCACDQIDDVNMSISFVCMCDHISCSEEANFVFIFFCHPLVILTAAEMFFFSFRMCECSNRAIFHKRNG